EAIQALTFSPDGSLLAASDRNETHPTPDLPALPAAFLATWRTDTGTLVGPPRELEVGAGTGRSDQLAFSPDGRLLAAGIPDGRVLILDPASGATTQTLSPSSGATSVAFAPDGTLATGTAAGTVDLWNPATGQALAPGLIAASAPITSLAFEPDGQRFVTAGYQEGSVKLWFYSTLQQEGPALGTDAGSAGAVAFAARGHGLLAIQDNGRGYSWPTSLSDWEARACQVAGRNFTREEWYGSSRSRATRPSAAGSGDRGRAGQGHARDGGPSERGPVEGEGGVRGGPAEQEQRGHAERGAELGAGVECAGGHGLVRPGHV